MNTQSLLQPNINYNESTADEFSTAKAYSTGNYCIYNNILYKFTSDKAAGAWDSSKVTSTTVATEISSLNDNLKIKLVYLCEENDSFTLSVGGTVMFKDATGKSNTFALKSFAKGTYTASSSVFSVDPSYGNTKAAYLLVVN